MKKESKKYVIIYLRVSTQRQFDDGFGLDAQLERCKAWCKLHDIPDDRVIVITDGGYSGGNVDRPGYKEMVNRCNNDEVETVIIYKLDRISRSIIDFSKSLLFFSERNVRLISISEDLDFGTAAGVMIAKILIIFAEYERQLDIERTNEAIIAMLKQGLYPFGGKRPPLGYQRIDHHLILDEKEKEVYRDLIQTYIETKSVYQTYIEMLEKYPNHKWSQTGISNILRNKVYLGGIVFKNVWYPNLHEPLINQSTYDKIQKTLGSHSKERKYLYLFRGIISCSCGHPMVCSSSYNHQRKLYLYYQCSQCNKRISENKLLDQMDPYLKKIKISDENKLDITALEKEKSEIEIQLAKLDKKKNEILDLLMKDMIIAKDYADFCSYEKKDRTEIEKKLKLITNKLKKATQETFYQAKEVDQFKLLHKNISEIIWDSENKKIKHVEFYSDAD